MRVAVIERGGQSQWVALEASGARPFDRSPFDGGVLVDGPTLPWADAELGLPVKPSKIVCVGRNYAEHAKELGQEIPKEPLLFMKPPSSLVGPGAAVVLPRESARVEHEAELAVVVGRRLRRADPADVPAAIYGFTCACDVTARDLQRKDAQWTRAKGFDSFCPVGPWIETSLDVTDLAVRCLVNEAVRQDGRTRDMLFDVPTLLAYVSSIMTLEPGDLVLTGTPAGVGPLEPGDRLTVSVEGIGDLMVGVVSAG